MPPRLRIFFHKISDACHALEIVRPDGQDDRAEPLESKSVLYHDFLHLAVESEARLESGFWGHLAKGRTLAEMNNRGGQETTVEIPQLMFIEQIVGAMSGAVKGRTAAEMMEGFRNFALAQGKPLPNWMTEEFIIRVQERMRRLIGHWNSTPYGGAMEVEWMS